MSAFRRLSRRQVLQTSLIAGGFGLASFPELPAAQELSPTPECRDGDEPTAAQIEGPFYKARSPERADLIEGSPRAQVLELRGFVLNRSCRPVPRVLVDFWHADETGDYDNRGFRYRGHVFSDADGRYHFRTIVPALYPGRTRHYHVKVLSTGRQLLTTQLYFPDEPANLRDGFFQKELVMKVAKAGEAASARFDFVLNLR